MNITKELMRYHTHINPIQFHCFANKQDIELFIPEFFESFINAKTNRNLKAGEGIFKDVLI